MKKQNHTLVVNLPMINSTICQKIVLKEVAPHSKREEKPTQDLKMSLSQDVLNLYVDVDVYIVRSCYICFLNMLDRCVCYNNVH